MSAGFVVAFGSMGLFLQSGAVLATGARPWLLMVVGPAMVVAGIFTIVGRGKKGAAAGAYRIPGLSFTAIIGPGGKLLVRHAGAVTDEQLTYVIFTLEQNRS